MRAEGPGDFVEHTLDWWEGCYVSVCTHDADAEGSPASVAWRWEVAVE